MAQTPSLFAEVPAVQYDAVISECGLYRYNLTRVWDDKGSRMLWIMLNPSTADASLDDRTICRCMSFARDMSYGSIEVVNLFAFRSTKPEKLALANDPVGPDNDRHIEAAIGRAQIVVAGWGAHKGLDERITAVNALLAPSKTPLLCFAVTKHGHPKHPLYVAGSNRPFTYYGAAHHTQKEAVDQ